MLGTFTGSQFALQLLEHARENCSANKQRCAEKRNDPSRGQQGMYLITFAWLPFSRALLPPLRAAQGGLKCKVLFHGFEYESDLFP